MANAGMKDIKRRIKSVESTMQITKAMELVASSKLRKAKERMENSRPFFNVLYETMMRIATNTADLSSVYLTPKKGGKPCFIVIAGDRGLAGGYNAGIFKLAQLQMAEQSCKVIAIGKKAVEYYTKNDFEMLGSYSGVAEDLSMPEVRLIAATVLEAYKKGEINSVNIIYTNFVSPLVQQPAVTKVLPLTFAKSNGAKDELTIYDPSPEAVFNNVVPQFVSGIIYGATVESYAAEQAARRTAMESASDNANEMIDALSLEYNRARQASITQEITEIVGGAGELGN